MGGEDAATGRKYAATEETPPRAWGRQRDFIVFFISFYFYPYFKTAASRPRLPLSPARHNRPPSISRLRCRLMLPLVRRPSSVAARQGHPCYFPAVADFRQGHTFRPLLLMQRWRGREGDPVRPQGGRSAKAGANITPATGRGRFAPMPSDTRRAGYSQPKRHLPRSRKRGVRGCRGCRGAAAPLTPCPAPGRRPAARAGQQPRCKEEEKRQRKPPFPRLTPCPTPGRRPAARIGQQPRCKEEEKRQRKPPFPRLPPCPAPGRRPAARSGQQPRCKEEQNQSIFSLKCEVFQSRNAL